MTYKCNHGREWDRVEDAIDCDLRSHFLDTHMLQKKRGGGNIDNWTATLGNNGKPLFGSLNDAGKVAVNNLPKAIYIPIVGQSISDLTYFVANHPDVVEDLLDMAKQLHAKHTGFKAGDAIKAAAAAGSKHTD